jgi:hypothetical protein
MYLNAETYFTYLTVVNLYLSKRKEQKKGKQYKKQLAGKDFIHILYAKPLRRRNSNSYSFLNTLYLI